MIPLVTKKKCMYIYCMDSILREDSKWYARFYIGLFEFGSRLQIRFRMRRSIINDFI